jgi:ABC-type glutathione transport system ATPase component
LEARHLTVTYQLRAERVLGRTSPLTALDDVSLVLRAGESVGVVGESGSGKTTLASVLIGLVKPSIGQVLIDGAPADTRSRHRVQMVYQDPVSSLNPRRSVGSVLTEIIRHHRLAPRHRETDRVAELLDLVGLPPQLATRKPRELSGGQRQRVCIARALAAAPDFLILDEAVAAVDVSIQAAVLQTLRDLQGELGIATLFISHDLAVIRNSCEHVAVMAAGRIVESGSVDNVFANPQHPYTQTLITSSPKVRARRTAQALYERGSS